MVNEKPSGDEGSKYPKQVDRTVTVSSQASGLMSTSSSYWSSHPTVPSCLRETSFAFQYIARGKKLGYHRERSPSRRIWNLKLLRRGNLDSENTWAVPTPKPAIIDKTIQLFIPCLYNNCSATPLPCVRTVSRILHAVFIWIKPRFTIFKTNHQTGYFFFFFFFLQEVLPQSTTFIAL